MAASTNYDHIPVLNNSQQAGALGATYAMSRVFGSCSTAPGAATKYLSAPGTTTGASAAVVLGMASQACTIQNLRAYCTTAPGGTDTAAITVLTSIDNGANFVASTLTCTITGAAVAAADTTHSVAVAAGVLFAMSCVSSAGTAAGIGAVFEVA